jgi:hypothetical protein
VNDPIFNNLMKHRCDIAKASTLPASDETYGHVVVERSVYTAVKEQIPCRLMSMSVQEMERRGLSPTMSGSYALYIHYESLPPGLSMTAGASSFVIQNITNRDGTLYDDGPFDITSIIDASGESHHAKLLVSRISNAVS